MSTKILVFIFLISAQTSFVWSSLDVPEIFVNNSATLYDKLCRNPTPAVLSTKFTFKTLNDEEVWYIVLGNDISRHHFGSMMKGKQLSRTDSSDYEGMCFSANKPFAQFGKIAIGSHNGFGKMDPSVYNCGPNDDFPGSNRCLDYNFATKYHSEDILYFTDTEEENVYVAVECFSNDEVGWETLSASPKLNNDEFTAVKNQVAKLGFDNEKIVYMYDEKCDNKQLKALKS